jgi:hypothetical protein
MSKIVTIHQPNYLPWIGFFSKVSNSDSFVILDNVEYTKNSVINRNKIRTKSGWCYLSIPVEKKYHSLPILQVKFPENNKWMTTHLKSIESNYRKAPYYESYSDFFENIYSSKIISLSDFNETIIKFLFKNLDISVEIKKASEIVTDSTLKQTDLLVDIVSQVGGDIYLSGMGGMNYLEENKFASDGIKLSYFSFNHPTYQQRFPGFEPYMSIIDLLFNVGDTAKLFL